MATNNVKYIMALRSFMVAFGTEVCPTSSTCCLASPWALSEEQVDVRDEVMRQIVKALYALIGCSYNAQR
jgi:hypothetical protein